jgi:hypothetical protein
MVALLGVGSIGPYEAVAREALAVLDTPSLNHWDLLPSRASVMDQTMRARALSRIPPITGRDLTKPKANPRSLAVTSCGDDANDPTTLRGAIAVAASGDTVDLTALQCSSITLAHGQIVTSLDDLVIQGPGRDQLTVDAAQTDRNFYHEGRGTFALNDLTVANGKHANAYTPNTYDGGCILSLGNVALERVTVTGCEDQGHHAYGGAIFAYEIYMESSTISNSVAKGSNATGGGVFVSGNGSGYGLTMVDSHIVGNSVIGNIAGGGGVGIFIAGVKSSYSDVSQNSALSVENGLGSQGGGIFVLTKNVYVQFSGVALALSNSSVSGNKSTSISSGSAGAGVYVQGPGTVNIAGTTISDNTVAGVTYSIRAGIGILGENDYSDFSVVHSIIGSTISGNSITGVGDAASNYAWAAGIQSTDALLIDESTISNNSVATGTLLSGFGGISALQLTMSNTTVAFNSAMGGCGGISVARNFYYPVTLITNTIIASNAAPDQPDIGLCHNYYTTGPITVDGSNDLISVDPANPLLVLPPDTIVADPRLLPLAANGGLTQTHAFPPDSPAVDHGLVSSDAYDQRGNPYVRLYGAATDIGSYELQPAVVVDEVFADGFDGL